MFHRSLPTSAVALGLALLGGTLAADEPAAPRRSRVAAIVTTYYHNSHADVIVSRLLETDTLDGKGRRPELELASLFMDQVHKDDKGRKLAAAHGVPIYDTVAGALTLGGDTLAVDGVLLIAEHGDYPESPTGQIQYPKRRLFGEIAAVLERNGRGVPVFCDKHLADTWEDARWFYDTARRLDAPLMAGSSLPGLWRRPPADVRKGAEVRELVAVSYHRLDTYGFHALEMAQCLVERRRGGETGVRAVQCLSGDAVWRAGEAGVYDRELLRAALGRLQDRPVPAEPPLEKQVPEPTLFAIEYRDGLKVNILTLNYAVSEWTAAWRYAEGDEIDSTLFWTQEARPFAHFGLLLAGIEKMMHTRQPTWPVERTLLTSGLLDELLLSRQEGGVRRETPHLAIEYQTEWEWREPPEPPEGRPIPGQ